MLLIIKKLLIIKLKLVKKRRNIEINYYFAINVIENIHSFKLNSNVINAALILLKDRAIFIAKTAIFVLKNNI